MQTRISTLNEKTIIQTVKPGQYIRNGFNHLFLIAAVTPTHVCLIDQDQSRKKLILPIRTFAQLYARKNYDQVLQPDSWLTEWVEAKRVGATRLLIK